MKIELIDKVNIKDLEGYIGNQYLSESHASGGSFLNNYHKPIPLVMIGVPGSTLPASLYITCENVSQNTEIIVEGSITNEYLLSDLVLSYSFVRDGDFITVTDRIPYAPWELSFDAYTIYMASYTSLYIKLEGNDYSTEDPVTIIHEIPIVLEEGCQATCSDLAIVEAALYVEYNYSSEVQTPVRVTIAGKSYITETLGEIKTLLNQEGIQVTFYEEYY